MVGQAVLTLCVLFAGSIDTSEAAEPRDLAEPPVWRIAPEASHYRYKEPGVMTNEGTLYGVTGFVTFNRHRIADKPVVEGEEPNVISWSMWRLDGRISAGEVDYDGSYMDGTPLSTSGTDDFLLDVRLLWSRHWRPSETITGAYVGLGYRYLNDDSSDQAGGYERESNYVYIPVGVRKDFYLADRWNLGVTGEFDMLLFGRQISHLDDANPNLPEVRNWQWPGFGAGLFLDLLYKGEGFDVGVGPFLRYWWVDESDVSNDGYYEPKNNTVEYGLSLIVQF
jgi:hypothetical protein